MIWVRAWLRYRAMRRELEVTVHAARWLLDENATLRSRMQDALAEVARRPHPDDLEALSRDLDYAVSKGCRCGGRKPDTGPADDAVPGAW